MMKQRSIWTMICSVGVLLAFVASLSFAGISEKDKGAKLEKTESNDIYHPFLINNVYNYYSNNGDGSFNKFSSDNEGFEFYKGDGKHVIFEDGVVWGGFHKGFADPKVGGSVYRHGLQAGRILTKGTATADPVADDASLPGYRVYRVRPDMNPNTVQPADGEAKLAAEEVPYITRDEPSVTASSLWSDYSKDWNEWPADQGAPFTYGLQISADGKDTVVRKAPMPYDPKYDVPGVKGADQTLWYVANDCNAPRVNNLAGCPIIGLEMQRTVWGYKRAGALGNTIFASSILINKSGARIDSMFMVQWSDPDLGDAGDDFVGCDTSRSLGFVYNGGAVDKTYGVACPAGGFDFFQGPIVPSATDSAVFHLKYRKGFKNLKMSAFVMFISTNPAYTDPRQGTGGNIDWYRLMNGTIASTGVPFFDPIAKKNTKFVFPGDPVKATDGSAGWVDGAPGGGFAPADRRLCLVTGPFTMAPGDTQELVVANLAGIGGDRLSSISALRSVDDKAQAAYNNLFVLPAPPPAPNVAVAQLNNQVILSWGDPGTITRTEGTVDQGFTFQGYKVYELAGPSFKNPILLGEWDLPDGVKAVSDTIHDAASGLDIPTVVQLGTDNGLIRSLTLNASKVTGSQLVNGNKYYFAVTAYSYNANPPAAAGTHALESPAQVITVIPQMPNPGTRYAGRAGDTLKVTQGGAASDGGVVPLVVDPTKLTGHQYKVTFATDADGNTTWNLLDVTAGKPVLSNQVNQAGDNDYAIVDGLQVKVEGPPPGMKTWTIPSGTRRFSPVGGSGLGLEGFSSGGDPNAPQDPANGTIGMGANFPFASTTLTASGYHDVLLKLAAVKLATLWDPKATQTDDNFSHGYRYLRAATAAPAKPEFAPWIVSPTAGYAYQDFNFSVPFSAWDQSTTPPTRLAVGHLENNVAGGHVDGRWWPGLTDTDNVASTGPREWCFIFATPYSTTPQAQYQVNFSGSTTPLMWVMSCARRAAADWAAGDQFAIFSNKVNTATTTYTFTAPTNTVTDPTLAKQDVQNINVFPNPYIGFNPQEINKYGRFVTFSHLPRKATIRIFNLAGLLVRTMIKDDPTQFYQWDLNNEKSFPVSAGMYIAFIDMPDLGVTKTLKLGIIPEQQYLDRW